MLSRVAERLYWTARYLERVEDTARLINAYSNLIFDIPVGVAPEWEVLIQILDAEHSFERRYKRRTERNVIKYLIADPDSPNSLRHAVRCARENVRTTRDVLPAKAWELVNELYLFTEAEAQKAIGRAERFAFLDEVIGRVQQINGLIASTVLRDQSLWFLQLGQIIERADMTTRVLDAGDAIIIERKNRQLTEVPTLWANLLESLSARSAYRRQVGPEMEANAVFDFLLTNQQFPRSMLFCLSHTEELVGMLRPPAGLLRQIRAVVRKVRGFKAAETELPQLHLLIDSLQVDIADIHGAVSETWFEVDAKV